ncbi:MAG: thiopeptide-type bacteriocin biosynthesis protein [Bacteroidales bacterium]|nr:thiopeptide-type bacteriocin biosynthesis protein [Bacteroidales bacterium]
MSNMQRTFIPGDYWLYLKIYTGFKTADLLLKEVIPMVTYRLLADQVITKWFFIHYSDPELHLRLRFLLTNTSKTGVLILLLNQALQTFIQNNLVWKVQLDTYQREIERYGEHTMELSESLFFNDSQYFTEILCTLQGNEAETDRWRLALVSVNALLNDFTLDLQQKMEFITMVKDNFAREFGLENSRSQLSDKYRIHRKAVEALLEEKEEKYQIIYNILDTRSKAQKPIANQIIQHTEKGKKLNALLSNYTHMMMNRWFRSKQRMHEAVVYDFLLKYYKSKIAREKSLAHNASK